MSCPRLHGAGRKVVDVNQASTPLVRKHETQHKRRLLNASALKTRASYYRLTGETRLPRAQTGLVPLRYSVVEHLPPVHRALRNAALITYHLYNNRDKS